MKKTKKWIPLSVGIGIILAMVILIAQITGFAAESTMVLKRNSAQNLNGAFSGYNRNGYNTTESMLLLNDQWAFCMEPSVNLNNLGTDGTVFYLQENGDGVKWLQQKYGWSFEKINNLSKAICYAKNYYGGDWVCNYALTQNLIWSEIKDNESYENAARYMLTDTGKYSCDHLNSKAKIDAAINDIWGKVLAYNVKPSYTGKVFQMTAGQKLSISDQNGVSDQIEIVNIPSGVQVTTGKNGLNITANASMAGKSVTINYKKKALPASGGAFIYGEGSRQKVGLWNNVINPVYGSIRIEFKRNEYLKAKYRARDRIAPSFDIHIEKTDADTGERLADAEFEVYRNGQKVATVKTDANGRAAYHWRGDARYTDYFSEERKVTSFGEWSSTYQSVKQSVLNKVENAVKQLRTNTKNTWKIVEVKAPDGYERNTESWEQTFDLNTHAVEVDFSNVAPGFLKMKKESTDIGLSAENPCYSLKGAEYGVYISENDALQNVNSIGTLHTDDNGDTETLTLHAGTYYIKEITASKGYLLCKEDDGENVINGVHKVIVKAKETSVFTCKEEPGSHAFPLLLTKMDADLAQPYVTQGNTSLEGAVFELSYYRNTEGNAENTPDRKWYFKTDQNGQMSITDESCLLTESYVMHNGFSLNSDELYRNSEGEIVYPLGTYKIKEVVAPLHFKLEGQMQFKDLEKKESVTDGLIVAIRQRTNGAVPELFTKNGENAEEIEIANPGIEVYDETQKGSIILYKRDGSGQKRPLVGVTFELEGTQTGDRYTGVTDEEGRLEWSNLIAQSYKITEIKTADGYNLLEEAIEVTLPMELSLAEITEKGADLNQSVYDEAAGKYCFYNLTFTVDNNATFDLPVTGSDHHYFYFLIAGGSAIAVLFGLLFFSRKVKRQEM